MEGKTKLKERTTAGTTQIDTTVMSDVWTAAALLHQDDEAGHPPEYIMANASYKSDPEGAEALARACARTMGALETFYCMSYKIDLEDRAHYRGRGQVIPFEMNYVKEKRERRARYASMRADWWSRTDNVLRRMAAHRKKGTENSSNGNSQKRQGD